jgi:50S ribosomal subunit-associated GTPase HflX
MVYALNKADLAADLAELEAATAALPKAVLTSATTGYGMDALREMVRDSLVAPLATVTLEVPYSAMHVLNVAPEEGRVLQFDYQADHVVAEAELTAAALGRLRAYVVAEA